MYLEGMLSSRIHPLQTARPYTHSLQKLEPSKVPIPVKYAAKDFPECKDLCPCFLSFMIFLSNPTSITGRKWKEIAGRFQKRTGSIRCSPITLERWAQVFTCKVKHHNRYFNLHGWWWCKVSMPAWQGSSWKSTLICQPVRDSVFFLAKFRQLAKKKNPVPPLKRGFKKKNFQKIRHIS